MFLKYANKMKFIKMNMNIDVIENIMAYIYNIMLTCLSFKAYAKSISLSVRLPSPLRCASLTNEATPSRDSPRLD